MDYQVSIIIATFNPDFKKFIATVKSAIVQEYINFEIIITDDGSKKDYFKEIKQYFLERQFTNYRFIKHKNNVGTVRNLLEATKVSQGEYISFISPGDYLFNPRVLHDFYAIANSKRAKVCFGDYVPYYESHDSVSIPDISCAPIRIAPFQFKQKYYKQYVMLGNHILGASFFRSREFFLEGLEYIVGTAKYLEDATLSAYALINDVEIVYVPKNIVWYECNTGISTSGGSKWGNLLQKDLFLTYSQLSADFPRDRVIKAKIDSDRLRGKAIRPIILFLKYPVLSIRKILLNTLPKRKIHYSNEDISYLNELRN